MKLKKKKKKKYKNVYMALSADILHEGHIRIINKASKLGKITIGLLTDEAIASFKNIPFLNYNQRYAVVKNIKEIDKVVPQTTLDYTNNLRKLKPEIVVHGDDWKKGVLKNTRQKVIQELKKWSGKLVEFPYLKGISSSSLKKKISQLNLYGDNRISNLKRLIKIKKFVRLIEAHNSLIGLIIENLKIEKKNKFDEFDGMWSSSLTDSLVRGKPDNQSVEINTRISGLSDLMDCTTKPVLFDADNGGRIEHAPYSIRSLERQGVSGIVIEDKVGLKRNSLFKDQKNVNQDSIVKFCNKIKIMVNSRKNDDFMVVARVESFILGKGLKDALKRSIAYSKAGADAILIHSKSDNPKEIFRFAKEFRKSKFFKPLIAVPSSYSKTREKELIKNGFSVVIYANQLLRATYPALLKTAKSILMNERSYDTEKDITPIKKIISLL
tara:strand:- start:1039 stop:2355 length:1317 start_codon:yes stop_codon:yes gene_type:complete